MDFVFDPSLALYLPLYELEGASFASRDAYGHLCTVTGAAGRLNGRYFDGVDDHINAGNSAALQVTQGTILAWFKTDTILSTHHIAGTPYKNTGWASPWAGFSIWQNTSTIVLNFNIAGVYKALASSSGEVVADEWYFAAVTWDGTTARIYKNGVQIVSDATLGTGDITYGTPTSEFMVGVRSAGSLDEYFKGTIGEVLVCNRVLSPNEIQHNYLATKWRYR